ncbi:hypothetical protein ACFXTO_044109 [Malus domestica]
MMSELRKSFSLLTNQATINGSTVIDPATSVHELVECPVHTKFSILFLIPNNCGEMITFPDLSAGSSGSSIYDAIPIASFSGASTAKLSTDKYRNSAVVAGVINTAASLGWFPKASQKKEEVQD